MDVIDPAGKAAFTVQMLDDTPRSTAVNLRGQKVDSANTSLYGHVVGLTMAQAMAGFRVGVVILGLLRDPSWNWTPDTLLYLNGTTISDTPPSSGVLLQMGVARGPTEIFVNPKLPLLL